MDQWTNTDEAGRTWRYLRTDDASRIAELYTRPDGSSAAHLYIPGFDPYTQAQIDRGELRPEDLAVGSPLDGYWAPRTVAPVTDDVSTDTAAWAWLETFIDQPLPE